MAAVLVIDDDPMLVRIYRACLGLRGHSVQTAGSLAEAEQRLAETAPELVLLDLHLADGNGLELVPAIRKRAPQCRILVFTGTGHDPTRLPPPLHVDHVLPKHINGPGQVGRAVDALLAAQPTPGLKPMPTASSVPPRRRPAGCATYPEWRQALATALQEHQGLPATLTSIIAGLDGLLEDQADPALASVLALSRQLQDGSDLVQPGAAHSLLAALELLQARCEHNLPPPRLPGRRVLLVDDQALSLRLLATALDGLGLDLVPARSAEEAVQQQLHEAAQLVITDVRMPGDSGVVLARRLGRSRIPPRIVLVSGVDGFERDFAPGRSIHAVIQKPFLYAEVAVTAMTQLGWWDLDRLAAAQQTG